MVKVDTPLRITGNIAEIGADVSTPKSSPIQPKLACEAGKFSTLVGDSERTICVACPEGYFQPHSGQNLCSPCAAGRYSNINESVMCASCEPGRYQNSLGATRCRACETQGEIPNDFQTDCEKPPWRIKSDCSHTQFLDDSSDNNTDYECASCPRGASCVGDINASGILAKFGWSQCPIKYDSTYKVPVFERCQF